LAGDRRRILKIILRFEEQAMADYVEAASGGADPERIEDCLDFAQRVARLRALVSSGIHDESLIGDDA